MVVGGCFWLVYPPQTNPIDPTHQNIRQNGAIRQLLGVRVGGGSVEIYRVGSGGCVGDGCGVGIDRLVA